MQKFGFVNPDSMANIAEYFSIVRLRNQMAEICSRILEVSWADVFHLLEQPRLEGLFHACRYKDSSAIGAHLAGAEEVGHHCSIYCIFNFGIWQDDDGRLAAELHGHIL